DPLLENRAVEGWQELEDPIRLLLAGSADEDFLQVLFPCSIRYQSRSDIQAYRISSPEDGTLLQFFRDLESDTWVTVELGSLRVERGQPQSGVGGGVRPHAFINFDKSVVTLDPY